MLTFTARRMTRIGLLAALASLLYLIPGIPVIPPIYKLDLSTIPVVIAGLSGGWLDAVIVLVIKDVTGLLHSSSMGVGELADLLCGAALVLSLIGFEKLGLDTAIASILSVLAMTLAGALVNYFIMIPFYVKVQGFPLDAIVGLISKTIKQVKDLKTLIMYATVPFNLIKGIVLVLLSQPIFTALKEYGFDR